MIVDFDHKAAFKERDACLLKHVHQIYRDDLVLQVVKKFLYVSDRLFASAYFSARLEQEKTILPR